MLVSEAPHSTVNPVPAVTVLNAGEVVIVPPAPPAAIEIVMSDVLSTLVFEIEIVPAAVQIKCPPIEDAEDTLDVQLGVLPDP